MKTRRILMLGSIMGVTFICAPIFYLVFYRLCYLEGNYKDLTFLKMFSYFVPGVFTGIIGLFLATKLLPSEFTVRTFLMGGIALPIGAFIYGLMAGFLLFIFNKNLGLPVEAVDILLEAKQEAFLTTFVFGHIFIPLTIMSTLTAQWIIILEGQNE